VHDRRSTRRYHPRPVDLVGNATYPPAYIGLDSTYLYLRWRVNADPSGVKGFDQLAWVSLLQVPSGNPFQYQYNLALNGVGGDDDFGNSGGNKGDTIEISQNTAPESFDFNPIFNDPSEVRLFAQRYDFSSGATVNTTPLARSLATGDGSNFSGNGDFFVEFAFPIPVLIAKGVISSASDLAGSLFLPATSANANNYNKDTLSCPSFLPQTTLDLQKSADHSTLPVNSTTPLTYTLVVTNTGTHVARGVVIDDPALPSYMTNVTVTVTSNDTSVTWSVISTNPLEVRVDTLPIGSSVTIEITADATPACNSDDFTNTATAFATNAPEVDGSATVQVDKSGTEICNGVDDNCNGQIDEGVSNMCPRSNDPADADNVKGVAANHCAVETCNCKDDNCNGVVDEGLPTNMCGGPCGCAVPPEICDGLDNNCNGDIDEGFLVGAACTNGQLGACRRGGILACTVSGSGTFCDAPMVTPSPEVCNGIDDDCNGQKDDGVLPGVGEKCGAALGVCMAGVTACVNGRLVCQQVSAPMPETCNGLDDDCDGVIDNGVLPGTGDRCLCPNETEAQVGVGVCKAGTHVCRAGKIACDGCVGPSPEICDGKDNDCDGTIDTMATCPGGLACREGSCTLVCKPGEFPCPAGYMCVGTFCLPQRCIGVTCAEGQKCDNDSGRCVDICDKVQCAAPAYCKGGLCVDCNTPGEGCAAGQLCVGGMCESDPCVGVTCGNGQYCSDGRCVDLCTHVDCSAAERCVAGKCVADPCAKKACAQDQFCDMATGACKTDTCQALQCPAGQRCIQGTGQCAPDPCAFVQCPAPCYACDVTSGGQATCKFLNDDAHPQCVLVQVTTGQKGGGCGCAIGAGNEDLSSRIALGLAALGLVMTARPRRRRRRAAP